MIDEWRPTVALLQNPYEWRIRVVEELILDSATSCLHKRSLQAGPLRPVLGPLACDEADHILVALNIATMPRGPLESFDLNGPCGPAWLLPRMEIAAREVHYLSELANSADVTIDNQTSRFLEFVLGFSSDLIASGEPPTTREYVEQALDVSIPADISRSWKCIEDRCQKILHGRIDRFREYSVPEQPGLAIPTFLSADASTSNAIDLSAATHVLEGYASVLKRMEQAAERHPDGAADEYLNSLADYGGNYELICAMEVPLDEPFLVKFTERRPLHISHSGHDDSQELVISDAVSNHVSVRIGDASVQFSRFEARKPNGQDPAYGAFSFYEDSQTRSFYAHDADRSYRVRLLFWLRLRERLSLIPYGAAFLFVMLAILNWFSPVKEFSDLAIVVTSSALAASILLSHDASTLASWLRWRSSLVLAIATLLLTASVGVSFVLHAVGVI